MVSLPMGRRNPSCDGEQVSQSTSTTRLSALAHSLPTERRGHWAVDALGAPHVGERTEKALVSSFVDRIAELSPQLVTFNGRRLIFPSCDIAQWSMKSRHRDCHPGPISIGTPKMRSISATFCPLSFPRKATLHELCRVMGLPGKPDALMAERSRNTISTGRIRKLPSTVKLMSSTPIGSGCDTNCFGVSFSTMRSKQARRI